MSNEYTYDVWMESQGIPIHRGYYIEDLRTVEVAPWSLRGCDAAFVQLEGMQGVVESRVQEIAPGASLPTLKFAALARPGFLPSTTFDGCDRVGTKSITGDAADTIGGLPGLVTASRSTIC